ncbi:Non-specific serine/threonine protein kinase [Altererythrobacter insulae]|nr:Non-specific serine/threonine protein kinase [Altererythrobacter insulae]
MPPMDTHDLQLQTTMVADVFLSYSRADQSRIEQLVAALEEANYSVWWDRYIDGGAEFSADIERELHAAKTVIVAWSKDSAASRWVRDEAGVALEAGKLIAISFDGTAPPLGFKQIHAVDMRRAGGLDDLKRSLANKLGQSAAPAASTSRPPARRTAKAAILAIPLIAGVGGLGYWVWQSGISDDAAVAAATKADAQSIAILPFRDLSAEPQSWFSDGLAQEISAALSRTPDLKVAPISESFRFRERQQSMTDIGGELGVARVLDGSVRRGADRIVVDIELIDTQSGDSLFTQRYDRPLSDTITVQEEIATRVARALNTALDPAALSELIDSGTKSVEAYEAFLRAQDITAGGEDGNGQAALEQYRRAQALDSRWSRAHITAAEHILQGLSVSSIAAITNADRAALSAEFNRNIDAAERTARNAGERDKAVYWRHYFDGDYNAAHRVISRITQNTPEDADWWRAKGGLEYLISRFDAAALSFARAAALEPELPHLNINGLYDSRAYEDAAAVHDSAPANRRNSMLFVYQSHRALLAAGRVEDAGRLAREMNDYEAARDLRIMVDIRQACSEGDRERAEAIASTMSDWPNTTWQALMHLGRTEDAVEVMRPFDYAEAPFPLLELLAYPFFDPRPYPNLMAVMERQNIPVPDRFFFNPPACPPA